LRLPYALGRLITQRLAQRRLCVVIADTDHAPATLVNNAGGWLPGPQYPEAREWRRSVDLNLVMPMLAAQFAVPMIINSGGRACALACGEEGPYPLASEGSCSGVAQEAAKFTE
jgi:NAD(P)-dependent dehydrogenase (short-subunit alcohol dehydrogenase family)